MCTLHPSYWASRAARSGWSFECISLCSILLDILRIDKGCSTPNLLVILKGTILHGLHLVFPEIKQLNWPRNLYQFCHGQKLRHEQITRCNNSFYKCHFEICFFEIMHGKRFKRGQNETNDRPNPSTSGMTKAFLQCMYSGEESAMDAQALDGYAVTTHIHRYEPSESRLAP